MPKTFQRSTRYRKAGHKFQTRRLKLQSKLKFRNSSKMQASKNLIKYVNPKQNMPYPPRYRTEFKCSVEGYIAAGAISGQYFVAQNSVHIPFSSGTWTNALPAIATLQPTGMSSLLNANLYTKYRVFGSKISMTLMPGNVADQVCLSITPSVNAAVPATYQAAITQPLTKAKLIQAGTNKRSQTLSLFTTQHQILGVPARAIADDLSNNYASAYNAPPGVPLWYVVNWKTTDTGVTANALVYQVDMTYYVELWADNTAALLQT